jgi:hypothetical protein
MGEAWADVVRDGQLDVHAGERLPHLWQGSLPLQCDSSPSKYDSSPSKCDTLPSNACERLPHHRGVRARGGGVGLAGAHDDAAEAARPPVDEALAVGVEVNLTPTCVLCIDNC